MEQWAWVLAAFVQMLAQFLDTLRSLKRSLYRSPLASLDCGPSGPPHEAVTH